MTVKKAKLKCEINFYSYQNRDWGICPQNWNHTNTGILPK